MSPCSVSSQLLHGLGCGFEFATLNIRRHNDYVSGLTIRTVLLFARCVSLFQWLIPWAFWIIMPPGEYHKTQIKLRISFITVTSKWARWRLKSPAYLLFTQWSAQAWIKETSKLRVTGLCEMNSPHKGPVTWKMFPFDDVSCYVDGLITSSDIKPLYETKMIQFTNAYMRPQVLSHCPIHMMTSSNWNIFRVTGHLCGEFTGLRWIPRTKASDAELWYFLWSAPEWMVQ